YRIFVLFFLRLQIYEKKEETPSLFHCIILPSAHKKLRFRTRAVAFVLFKVRINVIVPVLMLPAKTVPKCADFCFGAENDEKF
ncbi:MAG: hypothetical protein SPL77_05450, partial [Prevotella sp.]|nr:hypothetical protein [Prevotella sp.]